MYKIIASDLDGTLLTSQHQITDFTSTVLQQLHEQGMHFIFATGRHHIDVAAMRDKVSIPAYMITSNGACVHNSDNEIVFQKNLEESVFAEIIHLIKHDDELNINVYQTDGWLRNKDIITDAFTHSGFTYQIFDVNHPPVNDIVKIFITRDDQDHDKLAIWEEKLKAKFSDKVNVSFSAPYCLEIMDSGVSKGHALEAIAKMKGYELKNCMAFGDGMNDFEMLSMAGKGLVMGSSHYKVKLALPDIEVIGDCDNEAVAHYINEHLLK
jgi:Cof subfamily protein (haloacid dehalogenase superfamily)